MTQLKLLIVTLLMLCGVSVSRSFAEEGDHHGHEASGEKVMPTNAKDIWGEINLERQSLAAIIKEGELGKVHHTAFEIRDLVKALPALSTGIVAEDKLSTLRSIVERIEAHAANLDEFGDAGDAQKTEAEYQRFVKRLDYLAQLFPSEISGGSSMEDQEMDAEDHEGHSAESHEDEHEHGHMH